MRPLDESETIAFLHLARRMIVCDGEVIDAEREYLHTAAGALDLYQVLAVPVSLREAAARLQRPASRAWVMAELERLALRDGRASTSEVRYLQEVGEAFGRAPGTIADPG